MDLQLSRNKQIRINSLSKGKNVNIWSTLAVYWHFKSVACYQTKTQPLWEHSPLIKDRCIQLCMLMCRTGMECFCWSWNNTVSAAARFEPRGSVCGADAAVVAGIAAAASRIPAHTNVLENICRKPLCVTAREAQLRRFCVRTSPPTSRSLGNARAVGGLWPADFTWLQRESLRAKPPQRQSVAAAAGDNIPNMAVELEPTE